jgi:tetratricopeptide (TPR) repeat protein
LSRQNDLEAGWLRFLVEGMVFVVDLEREIRELKKIAALYSKRGRHPLAIQILQTALKLQLGHCGENKSIYCAETAFEIAELMSDNGQYNEAQRFYEMAVDIWRHHHPNDSMSLMLYSDALTKLQERAERRAAEQGDDEQASAA